MKPSDLNKTEIAFLATQGLTAADVYDARFESSAQWKAGARAVGLNVVLGSPCKAAGHRLRTRAGHCVQCDTSKLAYTQRHNSRGYVYIAGSKSARLVKVGTAVDIPQRERNLRLQRYGDIDDWVIVFSAKVEEAGRTEGDALRRLARYRHVREYEKDGSTQVANEILRTSFSIALKALAHVLEGGEFTEPWRHANWRDYDFRG